MSALDLQKHVTDTGGVAAVPGTSVLANDDFLAVPCEILIPAALKSLITADNAGKITAELIIEGANGPTTPEADDILQSNGVMVLPDIIANAGGVTVSYFEWVQDFSSFFWTENAINARLLRITKDAFAGVWNTAQQRNVRHRPLPTTTTFIAPCTRMLHAREMRGLYP